MSGGLKIGVRKDLMPNSRRFTRPWHFSPIYSLQRKRPIFNLPAAAALSSQWQLQHQYLPQCLPLVLQKLRFLSMRDNPFCAFFLVLNVIPTLNRQNVKELINLFSQIACFHDGLPWSFLTVLSQVEGQNKQPNGTILHSTLYKQSGEKDEKLILAKTDSARSN